MLFWIENSPQKGLLYAYKDLSFIDFERSVCSSCGRTIAKPQFRSETPHFLLEEGNIYPDCLWFTGAGRQPFLISERTLDLLERYRITGYSGYHPVTVEYVGEAKIDGKQPHYYALDISGKVDLDFAKMCLKKKRKCASCGQFDWNRQRLSPKYLDQSTWDGSDLCALVTFPGYKLCSERMKDLVVEHKLTGFSFEPAFNTQDT